MTNLFKGTFVALCFCFCIGCLSCEKYNEKKVKPWEFSGIILSKYRSSNHDAPVLKIRSAKDSTFEIYLEHMVELWNYADVNDSIYKQNNSLDYVLKKTDTTLVFHTICNGEILK